MSKKWFECKVKYRKTLDTGTQKVVTDSYLVDAVSFTEAESIIFNSMLEIIGEEFKITNIKPSNYSEIHRFEDCEKWFKSKVTLIAYDEESGKEKKLNIYLLIQANDVQQAYENTNLAMKNTMGDYSIPLISETNLIEVFEYQEN